VQWFSAQYQDLLRWSLKHRIKTLLIASLTFFAGLAIPATGLIGTEFVPQADYSETGVTFYTPVGSSIELTESKVHQVERVLKSFPKLLIPSTVNTGAALGKNYVTVFMRLLPRKDRIRSASQIAIPLRQRLSQVAGITVTHIGALDGVGGDNKQLRFSLQGSDLKELATLSEKVQAKLRDIPGIVDIDSSLKAEKPTISVTPKRDAGADLGVGVAQIGAALRPCWLVRRHRPGAARTMKIMMSRCACLRKTEISLMTCHV
jgi:HAE1 family hydrophobic/amphiphilic exporter-1